MMQWVQGMRDSFFTSLFSIAKDDKRVILITSDTGAICHDRFRDELKDQYINVGIAEQNMIGVAAGLAMAGKIVYVYAIIPFATMRCYEQIRVDLCCMNLPVTVVGVGVGFDYSTLGPTHHGIEDISLMRSLPEMKIYSPADSFMAEELAKLSYEEKGPKYIRLDRVGSPLVYKNKKEIDFSKGFNVVREGKDLYIIATGRMVFNALNVAELLADLSIDTGVIDLFKIKPFNKNMLWDVIKDVGHVVTLEEHFIIGGIGELVGGLLLNRRKPVEFRAIGIPHAFCRSYGTRDYLYRINGIDKHSMVETINKWIKTEKKFL
ncbi:MAG: 1-deoxy-D-xylulose-5-phosphate synthase [Candidatus Omnitrophica bacterium]|nr:1-deoxy-D-xylulose-5-phosphate synthase [Candidatus Omnitrophota bacterium]MCK5287478.1 1-deoxy-D-xylulose-5-phosphate synthase [Candidatus Omnitrophota bacterium]MCK5492840.1 1-deoxy-D-xylulose-5-phosphate synthase [Candidatus Omnitrophota bacterium]